jgi:hypothetical protein
MPLGSSSIFWMANEDSKLSIMIDQIINPYPLLLVQKLSQALWIL